MSLRHRVARLEAGAGGRPEAIVFYDAAGRVERLDVFDAATRRYRPADPATPLGSLAVVSVFGPGMARLAGRA